METELKLEFAADGLAALRDVIGPRQAARDLVSTYFDTPTGRLATAGFTLRVRSSAGRFVQTVKAEGAAAAGLYARPEWEIAVPSGDPVIDDTAGPIVAIVGDERVEPRFVTAVSRIVTEIVHAGALVEVAIDTGLVLAGDREAPISELELELKAGPVSALFALARDLDAVVPLRLAVRSKFERGAGLSLAPEPATKAEPIRLDRQATATGAFVAIAGACLRHFRLNEARLLAGMTGPSPLHQARVALRRLRTAVSLFEPLFEGDVRAGVFASELRALAAMLGSVRDLDVMIARHDGVSRDRLADARATALKHALAALESPATRRLMIDLAEWLAVGDWRVRDRGGSARAFASDVLDRRRKRLKRRGAALSGLDDAARHRARIAAKKLRYAAEFFAGLWDGSKARRRHRRFLDAIETLQEELGRLNDAATAREISARLSIEPAGAAVDPASALARADAAFEELMDVKRFWR